MLKDPLPERMNPGGAPAIGDRSLKGGSIQGMGMIEVEDDAEH